MPKTSKPETDTAAILDETPADGASVVLEAPTAEAALGAVHDRYGPEARVVDARRVLRGGVRGFFAKEHVQLHVAPASGRAPATGAAPASSSAPTSGAVRPDDSDKVSRGPSRRAVAGDVGAVRPDDSDKPSPQPAPGPQPASAAPPVTRLLADASDADTTEDFGSYLRRTLASTLALDAQRHAAAETQAPSPMTVDTQAPSTAAGDTSVPSSATADTQAPSSAAAETPAPSSAAGTRRQADELWAAAAATTSTSHDQVPAAALSGTGPLDDDQPGHATNATRSLAPPAWPRVSPHEPTVQPSSPVADVAEPHRARAQEETVEPSTPVADLPEPPPSRDPDEPAWSHTALVRSGLPVAFFQDLDLRSGDDLGWTTAVAEALGPLCRPLPGGPGVLVGPGAEELIEVAQLPAARSGTWLSALGADRWRHLVIGGDGWRDQLEHDPLAVSWTRPEYLPEAVRCAAELGLVLGYGPLDGRLRRARPLGVALAIRALMERS